MFAQQATSALGTCLATEAAIFGDAAGGSHQQEDDNNELPPLPQDDGGHVDGASSSEAPRRAASDANTTDDLPAIPGVISHQARDGSAHAQITETDVDARAAQFGVPRSETDPRDGGAEKFGGFGDDDGAGGAVVPEPAHAADDGTAEHGLYNTDETAGADAAQDVDETYAPMAYYDTVERPPGSETQRDGYAAITPGAQQTYSGLGEGHAPDDYGAPVGAPQKAGGGAADTSGYAPITPGSQTEYESFDGFGPADGTHA